MKPTDVLRASKLLKEYEHFMSILHGLERNFGEFATIKIAGEKRPLAIYKLTNDEMEAFYDIYEDRCNVIANQLRSLGVEVTDG